MYCLEKKILSLWPVIAVFIFIVAGIEISKSVLVLAVVSRYIAELKYSPSAYAQAL